MCACRTILAVRVSVKGKYFFTKSVRGKLLFQFFLTDRRTAKIVRQTHKRPFYGHALYAIFNTRSQERIVTSFIMSCWEFPCGFLSFFRFTVRLKIVILWASTWGILSNKNLKSWRSAVKRPLVRLSVKAPWRAEIFRGHTSISDWSK